MTPELRVDPVRHALGRRGIQRRRRQRVPGLGRDRRARRQRALCVTAESPSYPAHHRQLALRVAREFNLHHENHSSPAKSIAPEYRANPENRCYFCKHELYTRLTQLARERGFAHVTDGTNADDRGDYRPGRDCGEAVRRAKPARRSRHDESRDSRAVAPRRSAGVGRAGVGVPLVAHSVPHEVTPDKLRQIERGEEALHALGFRVCRVRHHDTLARVEVAPRRARPRVRARHARRDRARAAGRRVRVGHDRSQGVSHRQLERRPYPSPDLKISPKSIWACALAAIFLVAHLCVSAVHARRPRLDELRARRARLRSRRNISRIRRVTRCSSPSGKLSHAIWPSEAGSLSLWSAVFGALSVFPLLVLFRNFETLDRSAPEPDRERRAALATLVAVASPLFWFTVAASA